MVLESKASLSEHLWTKEIDAASFGQMSSKSIDLHRVAFELSPTGMLAVDADGIISIANAEIERLFGYACEELIGQALELLIPERFRPGHGVERDNYFRRAVSRPMGSGRALHGRRKDGSEFPVEVGLNVVETADGVHVVASVADVSERRRAEIRFQAAFEAAVNGLVLIDEAGVICLANRAMGDKFGYCNDELVGMEVGELMPERFRSHHSRDLAAFMQAPADRRMGAGRELFGLRKDRSEFPVEIGLKPITTGQERFVLATIVDITERKQMEARIRRSQRAEAVGALANGIAHDFNNILQGIVMVADNCLMTRLDASTRKSLQLIVQSADRGRDLVARILSFGRNAELPKRNVAPVDEIREFLGLLRASKPSNITLREDLAESCPEIHSDPSLLHQVVMNLATNSIQAMAGGGTLSISVGPSPLPTPEQDWALPQGLYVHLIVEDDGAGMSPEVRERAFDPFFTTKGPGRGSGLGLAIVKGIVEAHNGSILLESSTAGTRVEIMLPALSRADSSRADEAADGPRVMLVDDDVIIGEALQHALRLRGMRATFFPSAVEALAALEIGDRWDLILTDNGMPIMDGIEFARAIRAGGHSLPIVLLTGYMPPHGLELTALGIDTVLIKPVHAIELVACIRQRLGLNHEG